MARKSKLTKPRQWWKHMKAWKRVFWKEERKAYKQEVRREQADR